MEERRQLKLIHLPPWSRLYAEAPDGTSLGWVRSLGCGGALIETRESYPDGKPHALHLIEPEDGIRCRVMVEARYASASSIGFEFVQMDAEALPLIVTLILKYSAENTVNA
jgi:hypothetical protein